MENFFKYPTHSSEDLKWGLVLKTLGYTVISPGSIYPPLQHPKSHQFDVMKTRRVSEYQIVYITVGKGQFEAENGISQPIEAGSIFLLFPGISHRYRPDKETGWTEYYVGVEGDLADNLLKNGFVTTDNPTFKIGIHEHIVRLFHQVFDLAKSEKMYWQQAAAGAVYHLFSAILHLARNQQMDSSVEKLIERLRTQIAERISEKINWQALSKENGISYSKMRKDFKAYMGMTLGDYLLQLRLTQAKLLLSQTNEPIKQIALDTGFQNEYYFSTVFKKAIGVTPGTFRSDQ